METTVSTHYNTVTKKIPQENTKFNKKFTYKRYIIDHITKDDTTNHKNTHITNRYTQSNICLNWTHLFFSKYTVISIFVSGLLTV